MGGGGIVPERARFLARARELFAAVYGDVDGPLHLLIRDGNGRCVRVEVPAECNGTPTPMADAVLEVLRAATAPLAAKVLAKRAGYAYGSRFRQVLADLTRTGHLSRTADGYSVTTTGHNGDGCRSQL